MVIRRNDNGKLVLNHLDTQVMFDGLFYYCKTEKEVEWLQECLQGYLEGAAEDAIENL